MWISHRKVSNKNTVNLISIHLFLEFEINRNKICGKFALNTYHDQTLTFSSKWSKGRSCCCCCYIDREFSYLKGIDSQRKKMFTNLLHLSQKKNALFRILIKCLKIEFVDLLMYKKCPLYCPTLPWRISRTLEALERKIFFEFFSGKRRVGLGSPCTLSFFQVIRPWGSFFITFKISTR